MILRLLPALILSILLISASAFSYSPPVIEKIEPSNWWTGHSVNPVRVLIKGKNLRPADPSELVVRSVFEPIEVTRVRVNPSGTYAFVDLRIRKNAKPGSYPLKFSNEDGTARFRFRISSRRSRSGRSISNSDIIYKIDLNRIAGAEISNKGSLFKQIEEGIPALKRAGITAILLTPWYEGTDREAKVCGEKECSPKIMNHIEITDFFGVEGRFGTILDLQRLVATSHRHGIKVIQTQALNSVSAKHVWNSKRPLPGWFNPFIRNSFRNSIVAEALAPKSERDLVVKGWFDENSPDLNQSDPEVSRYLLQNSLWWIETIGVDGIRLNNIEFVPRVFLRDLSIAVAGEYDGIWKSGEANSADPLLSAFFQGGKNGWDGIDTELDSVVENGLDSAFGTIASDKKGPNNDGKWLKSIRFEELGKVILPFDIMTDSGSSKSKTVDQTAKLQTAFALTAGGIPQISNDGKWAFILQSTEEASSMIGWTRKWLELRNRLTAGKPGPTLLLHRGQKSFAYVRDCSRRAKNICELPIYIFGYNTSGAPDEVLVDTSKFLPEDGLKKESETIVVNVEPALGSGEVIEKNGNEFKLKLPPRSVTAFGASFKRVMATHTQESKKPSN
ncbi:MAG: hypothetical protein HKN33_10370 [Pyrinomonadaceae bacterium]|nr:hypothetical protein [Pyrinomonadaceae bacterium]